MASSHGVSPRCNQSPLLRRKRDAAVANQQCVQVQWRFLQHQNPVPPKFSAVGGKSASLHSKQAAAQLKQTSSDNSEREPRGCSHGGGGSPSKLFQLFANPQVDVEIDEERAKQQAGHQRCQQQQKRGPHQCRVLSDILGETQRKAMLSRIMAEMEALALQTDQPKPKSRHKRCEEHSQLVDEGASRQREDEDKLIPLFRKHSGGLHALRSNLAPPTALTPFSQHAICLLPQRRISALGVVCLDELAAGGDRLGSEEDDEDGDDDDKDDGDGDSDNGEDAADGMRKRTAESIAMAEIRKLKKRHRRRQQRLDADGCHNGGGTAADTHIFWQKSSRVKVALDIPASLRIPAQLASVSTSPTLQSSSRVPSIISMGPGALPPDIAAASSTTFADEQQSFNNLVTRRRRPFLTRTDSTQSAVSVKPASPKRPSPGRLSGGQGASSYSADASGSSLAASQPQSQPPSLSPRDVRKLQAPYGAWYLPRHQWWDLHKKERQALAERFPDEAEALAQGETHDHCHHHGLQDRSHKSTIVVAAAGAGVVTVSVVVASPRKNARADFDE